MNYYYNETERCFAVTTNFAYNPVPKGYVEITKEEYEILQEELNKASEEAENAEQFEFFNVIISEGFKFLYLRPFLYAGIIYPSLY